MQCFKVKDTNTGRDRNYVLSKCSKSNVHVFIRQSFACFQIIFAVNHIMYAFICTHSFYSWLYLWQYLCATLYIPVRSAKVSRVSLPMPVPLFICLPLLVCPFTFTEKPDCENITFTTKYTMCFLRLKFTILVKILQMILDCYCICYASVFLSLSVSSKQMDLNGVASPTPAFIGTWSFSCWVSYWKKGVKKKLKGVRIFKGDLKTFFLGGTGTLTDTMNTVSFS